MENRFNIRVYGICIANDQLLVNEEIIRGQKVTKLPGGGLNRGEGTIDCLKREWKEELGLDIEVGTHFYTTDFYQPSAYDDSQVISIYYLVSAHMAEHIINSEKNERTYRMNIKDVHTGTFTLPIDRVVGGLLQQWYVQNKDYNKY